MLALNAALGFNAALSALLMAALSTCIQHLWCSSLVLSSGYWCSVRSCVVVLWSPFAFAVNSSLSRFACGVRMVASSLVKLPRQSDIYLDIDSRTLCWLATLTSGLMVAFVWLVLSDPSTVSLNSAVQLILLSIPGHWSIPSRSTLSLLMLRFQLILLSTSPCLRTVQLIR